MIVTTADLYQIAYGKYAIGAYNVNNLEQILGMFRGCIDSQAPFIIQLSKGARHYADKRMLEALVQTAKDIWSEAIFAVHLDHGDEDTCYDCIASGFYSSVMIDASHEPFDENVEITTCLGLAILRLTKERLSKARSIWHDLNRSFIFETG
jgi:fructose-bisphosphate aldolase, class II